MKNKIQIFSVLLLLLYFIPKLLRLDGFTESLWYEIACFMAIIALAFFELKRLLKFDKINNTNKFKKRLLLVLSALVVFIIFKILSK